MNHLSERLFRILSQPDFLSMKGQANDVPIFIQTYEPEQEDAASRMVESLPANPGDAIARRAEHRANVPGQRCQPGRVLSRLVEQKTPDQAAMALRDAIQRTSLEHPRYGATPGRIVNTWP